MTTKQTSLYWREWAAVRAAKPDADRHDLHHQALGHPKSSKDFDNQDLDKVLAVFRAISDPGNLTPQLKAQNGRRHRLEHRLSELTQCLGLYVEDPAGYVAKMITDRWGVPTSGTMGPDDLSDEPTLQRNRSTKEMEEGPSQLHQLVITLWARIRVLARAEGHSVADTFHLAGISNRKTSDSDNRHTGFSADARRPKRAKPEDRKGRGQTPAETPVAVDTPF